MRRLFVISDLHLGGRPDSLDAAGRRVTGFQINNSYAALVAFVDWVASVAREAAPEEVELVVNGDIVDFLAEDDPGGGEAGARVWTADEAEARARLDLIALRTREGGARGVFEALGEFVAAGNRLTLLLGNHDVELSLPRVRERLGELVGRAGLVRFVYDGEAYTPGRVLIEHGNRYDRWNMLDYSALRQERSMLSRGLAVEEAVRQERYFVPPAGTYLVVHFMNRVKARYRFIDLLKPETNAMLPLLLALEPDLRQYLGDILNASPIVRQYLRHGLETPVTTKWPGDLSAAVDAAVEELSLDRLVLDTFRETGAAGDAALFVETPAGVAGDLGVGRVRRAGGVGASAGDLSIGGKFDWLKSQMRKAGEWFTTRAGQFGDMAESASLLVGVRRAGTPEERLRQLHAALRRLNRDDGSFSLEREEANYLDAARETSAAGDFDAVLYGHTHLPKKVPLGEGGGGRRRWYLNTGTWCDVIRLPAEVGDDYEAARPTLEAFADALGRNDYAPYVRRYLSYAELVIDDAGGGRLAEEPGLYSFCGPGRERSAPLTEAPHRGGVTR